jgi:hypothetical protein
MSRRRARALGLLAARCAIALAGGCDVDGVTPVCPEAGSCVTLPPSSDAGAIASDDAALGGDAGDGADEASAASP